MVIFDENSHSHTLISVRAAILLNFPSPCQPSLLPRSGLRPGSGPQLILPPAVSRDVRTQFGRHCQQLDELLGGLESTSDQVALLDFMAIHQAAQAAFLRLARSGGSVNFCELS